MKSMTSSDKLFISLVLLAYTGNNGSNNLTRISSTGMKQTSPLPHFEWKWAHADVKTPEHPDGRHPLLWPLLTVSYGHTWLQASLHSQCFLELSLFPRDLSRAPSPSHLSAAAKDLFSLPRFQYYPHSHHFVAWNVSVCFHAD